VWVLPYMFSGRNTRLKYMNARLIDVRQWQLNNERLKDANAANITLLGEWPEKISSSERDWNPWPLCYRWNALPKNDVFLSGGDLNILSHYFVLLYLRWDHSVNLWYARNVSTTWRNISQYMFKMNVCSRIWVLISNCYM